jgi:hypothetical protein
MRSRTGRATIPTLWTGFVCLLAAATLGDGMADSRARAMTMRLHVAQVDGTSPQIREMLEQQVPIESRRRTVVPAPGDGTSGAGETAIFGAPRDPEEADKLRRVQRLIEDVERRRGAQLGTVKAVSGQNGDVRLVHDMSKLRGNLSTLGSTPFGGAMAAAPTTSNVSAVVTPADVEYRVNQSHTGGEQVVGVKSNGDLAASAFMSGEAPVSVELKTADLTARQIEGPGEVLPVSIKVGDESRVVTPGTVERFGNLEVVVQASSNRSGARAYFDGPPYALRLQVRTAK